MNYDPRDQSLYGSVYEQTWWMPDTEPLKEPLSLGKKFRNSILLIGVFSLLHRIPIIGLRWFGESTASRVGLFKTEGSESRTHLFQNVRGSLWLGDMLAHVLLKLTQAIVINIKGRKQQKVTRRVRNLCSLVVLPIFAFNSILGMYRDPFFLWTQVNWVPVQFSKPLVAFAVFSQLLVGSFLSMFINMHCRGRVLMGSAFPWSLFAEAAYALFRILVDPSLFTTRNNFDVRHAAGYTLLSLLLLLFINDWNFSFRLKRATGGYAQYPPTPLIHTDTMIFALLDQMKSSVLWLLTVFNTYASVKLIPERYWLHFEPQPAAYVLYLENPRWKQILLVQMVTNVLGFILGSYITVYLLKQGDGASMAQNLKRAGVTFEDQRGDIEVLTDGCEGIVDRAMRRTYLLGPLLFMCTNIFPLLGLSNTSFLVLVDYVSRIDQEIKASPEVQKGMLAVFEPTS